MLMKQPPKPVTSEVAERDEFCTNKRYLIMKDESGRTGMLAIVDLLWVGKSAWHWLLLSTLWRAFGSANSMALNSCNTR